MLDLTAFLVYSFCLLCRTYMEGRPHRPYRMKGAQDGGGFEKSHCIQPCNTNTNVAKGNNYCCLLYIRNEC